MAGRLPPCSAVGPSLMGSFHRAPRSPGHRAVAEGEPFPFVRTCSLPLRQPATTVLSTHLRVGPRCVSLGDSEQPAVSRGAHTSFQICASSDTFPEAEPLGQRQVPFLFFEKIPYCFPQWL